MHTHEFTHDCDGKSIDFISLRAVSDSACSGFDRYGNCSVKNCLFSKLNHSSDHKRCLIYYWKYVLIKVVSLLGRSMANTLCCMTIADTNTLSHNSSQNKCAHIHKTATMYSTVSWRAFAHIAHNILDWERFCHIQNIFEFCLTLGFIFILKPETRFNFK